MTSTGGIFVVWFLEFLVDTFFLIFSELNLARLDNFDSLQRLISRTLCNVLNLIDDFIIALNYLPEDNMFAIEPGGNCGGDEELGSNYQH